MERNRAAAVDSGRLRDRPERSKGGDAAKRGDWDAAVAYYREAVAPDPKAIEARSGSNVPCVRPPGAHHAREETRGEEQWPGAPQDTGWPSSSNRQTRWHSAARWRSSARSATWPRRPVHARAWKRCGGRRPRRRRSPTGSPHAAAGASLQQLRAPRHLQPDRDVDRHQHHVRPGHGRQTVAAASRSTRRTFRSRAC